MHIDTVQLSHILETSDLQNLHYFLSHTAFVISHKSEPVKTLREVLWYLPLNSPIIIVTNCQEGEREHLLDELKLELAHHQKVYLVHQKEGTIARFFEMYGVYHILGEDGKVINGKGEGMYIGTLCAYQLGYPRWIIYYDADNFVPSALLEYTLAMSKLFMTLPCSTPVSECDITNEVVLSGAKCSDVDLHNVRICWSSKPELTNVRLDTRILGRCTRVVSPLFNELLEGWFGMIGCEISSSNAGEQGMTIKTALSLRFSSGFSVETLQLIDLLSQAYKRREGAGGFRLQQYLSKSPHFHEKKGDQHIKKMIEESLGSFFHYEQLLPGNVKRQLRILYDELCLDMVMPSVYPALQDLQIERNVRFMDQFSLSTETTYQDVLAVE
jgi:mannosyl-3-phosphoglycerate synthase